jgi:hypothetical protein
MVDPGGIAMRRLLLALFVLALALPTFSLPAAADALAKDVALVRSLQKQRLTEVEFKETDLKGIVKWLRVATSKNILIKTASLAKAGVEWEELTWTVQLSDVSAWTFLSDVVCQPHGMALKVKGNIVFITSKADSHGKPVTRMYGISHITWTKTDFIAPDINLHPSNFTPMEEYEPEKVVEDDPLNTGEAVAELVKEMLLPKGWEANDDWAIRATDRYLVVRAPADVHRRMHRTLALIASMK